MQIDGAVQQPLGGLLGHIPVSQRDALLVLRRRGVKALQVGGGNRQQFLHGLLQRQVALLVKGAVPAGGDQQADRAVPHGAGHRLHVGSIIKGKPRIGGSAQRQRRQQQPEQGNRQKPDAVFCVHAAASSGETPANRMDRLLSVMPQSSLVQSGSQPSSQR